MFALLPVLLYFLVLLDVHQSYQEIQKCNGVISVCLQNTANLSQLYISNRSNETSVKSSRRKNTSRIHKKNRRKNVQRKSHRHSTRVLSLKPATILLPPYENDIQGRNVSTLNPFIINVLAISKNPRKRLNKPYPNIISIPELEQNQTNVQNSNIVDMTTEPVKNPVIVPPLESITHHEIVPTKDDLPFSNVEVKTTPSNDIEVTNTPPQPFRYLLPPFPEIGNNALDTQLLESPNDVKLPDRPTINFEISSSFSSNQQPITYSSATSLSVEETVSSVLNQTASYDSLVSSSGTTSPPIFDHFNKTSEENNKFFIDVSQGQEHSYSNFNNTLLAPEIASLGMKIVTSRKGLEMIKEMVTSKEPKIFKNHQQYDESQSLLETAESGDIRLHTYNQILSVEEAKDVAKDMYKALQKPRKDFELCSSNQGYVADQSSGCQVFYICLGSGAGEPMMCPNGTLFNQEVLVCDWWYNVEC